MMVFGGRGGRRQRPVGADLLGIARWRRIDTVGTPPAPRFDHVMVFDPSRYRILVFGGMDAGGAFNERGR